jgi:hypothetical protein
MEMTICAPRHRLAQLRHRFGASLGQRLRLGVRAVPDRDLMAGRQQAAHHRLPHQAYA